MAKTGGVVELFKPGDVVTMTTGAAVTAGRMVALTGDRTVGPAGAGSLTWIGWALETSDAAGDTIGVIIGRPIIVCRAAAGSVIAAGTRVECAAAGEVRQVQTVDAAGSFDPRAIVGTALAAIAAGADGPVALI